MEAVDFTRNDGRKSLGTVDLSNHNGIVKWCKRGEEALSA
jgi:hypothetical protein